MEHTLALIAVLLLSYAPSLVGSWRWFAYGGTSRLRATSRQMADALALDGLRVFILAYTFHLDWWDGRSIGLHHDGWVTAIFLGAVAYGLYLATVGDLLQGNQEAEIRSRWRSWLSLWPREPHGKRLTAALLMVNPFVEEIVSRGLLVYALGHTLGTPWPGIALGLVFCIVLHLYQGRTAIGFHIGFYLVTVALLYSPLGLLGAIACHFLADTQALRTERIVRGHRLWRARVRAQRDGLS